MLIALQIVHHCCNRVVWLWRVQSNRNECNHENSITCNAFASLLDCLGCWWWHAMCGWRELDWYSVICTSRRSIILLYGGRYYYEYEAPQHHNAFKELLSPHLLPAFVWFRQNRSNNVLLDSSLLIWSLVTCWSKADKEKWDLIIVQEIVQETNPETDTRVHERPLLSITTLSHIWGIVMERSPFVQVAVIGNKRCPNLHALYMTIQDITCSLCHAQDLGGKRHADCSQKDPRGDAEAGLGLDLTVRTSLYHPFQGKHAKIDQRS